MNSAHLILSSLIILGAIAKAAPSPEVVKFNNSKLTLGGILFKPEGNGPFPAVLYNHGSAPGMLNNQAAEVIGPLYVKHGWVFFMPYRRGQGLSASAGKYIGDQIRDAEKAGGMKAAQETMVRILSTDHLSDQLSALQWLRSQPFVKTGHIAAAGNSFGGIETVLGTQKESYCAGIDASGGAESWGEAHALRELMFAAVKESRSPIFFFQAKNDFDLSPSKQLSEAMKKAKKDVEMKIYPAFGETPKDGHSFAYRGSEIWEHDVFRFLNTFCGSSSK